MCKGPSMPRNGQISGLHPCLQCVVFTESCWVQSRICCLVFICISHHFILLDQILLGSKALLFQSWALNTHLSQFSCFHSWLRAHLALQREPPQISSVTFATKPYLTSLQHETLSSFPNCMLLSASYFSTSFHSGLLLSSHGLHLLTWEFLTVSHTYSLRHSVFSLCYCTPIKGL